MVLTAANRCVTIHVDHIAALVAMAINSIMMDTHVEVSTLKCWPTCSYR